MSACTCPCPECGVDMDAYRDEVTRLNAALDAAQAEIARLRRGGDTLGQIIDRQGRELIKLTDSQDVIGEDGDGDWEVVWERLNDMKRDRGALLALIDAQPHEICEDGWYSCSQAVDPYSGDSACIDETRRGKPCDCGRDALVTKARAIVGGAS